MEAQGLSLSVLIVDYPLTPKTTFPSQFQEAVNAVRYVLETCDYQPSQIILGGDSAGGNLAAAVILHCLQPSEHVAPLNVVSSASKFKGLVLISPWVSFDTTLGSFTQNPGRDYIQAETEKFWSDSYLSKGEPCIYNEPGLASATQWKDMPVQEILVTAGADELLIDGITKWVEDIKVTDSLQFNCCLG
jgi:acetyl esterase/lipase